MLTLQDTRFVEKEDVQSVNSGLKKALEVDFFGKLMFYMEQKENLRHFR